VKALGGFLLGNWWSKLIAQSFRLSGKVLSMSVVTTKFCRISRAGPPAMIFCVATVLDGEQTIGEAWVVLPSADAEGKHAYQTYIDSGRVVPVDEFLKIVSLKANELIWELLSTTHSDWCGDCLEFQELNEVDIKAYRSLHGYPGLQDVLRKSHSSDLAQKIRNFPSPLRNLDFHKSSFPQG
jgi:hypothetical protein